MKTFIIIGQRYDYSRFPIARVLGHRQALAQARKSLHCSRIKKLRVDSGNEEAYTSPQAEDDDAEAVVYVREVL